jgi:hypothetical protein
VTQRRSNLVNQKGFAEMGDVIYITHHKVGSRAGLGPGAHVAVGWVVKRQSAAAARRWTKRLLVERRVPHGSLWAIRTEDGMGCTTVAT